MILVFSPRFSIYVRCFNSIMNNVEKWPKILQKSSTVQTARFFKCVWPIFGNIHEKVYYTLFCQNLDQVYDVTMNNELNKTG